MKIYLDKIKARLPQGQFGRSVALLAGGTAMGQGIVLLSSPLLTRLFTPSDFGILAAYASVLTIIVTIASLKYELAINLPKDDKDAMSIMVLAFVLLLVMTSVLSVAVIVFKDTEAPTKFKLLKDTFWLLPIGFLGAGACQILSLWTVRKKKFRTIAQTKLSQGVGMVITQLALGYLQWGSVGLIIGDIIGRVAGTATFTLSIINEDLKLLGKVTFKDVQASFTRYYHFFLYGSASSMLNIAGLQLPALLLTLVYDPKVAGWFALSQRIIGIPMRLVGSSVAQVYLAESSRLAHSDTNKVRTLFIQTSKKLFLYGSIPLIILGVLGPFTFEYIFGNGWGESGYYVLILVPMFLMQFVVSPLSYNSVIFEKQGKQFIFDFIRVLVVTSILLLPKFIDITHYVLIIVYSSTMCVAYIIYFLFYKNIIPSTDGGKLAI